MNGTTLGGDPRRLLTHMSLYGLAAICEEAGHDDLRLSWTSGMTPSPHLNLAPDVIGPTVKAHAEERDWVRETITLDGKPRGLMSPRLSVIKTDEGWRELQDRRHAVLDTLTADHADLDLRLLGALGEPCYWRHDPRTERRLQDEASSRLEMQPRNTGAEFIGTRLSKLAEEVAGWSPGQIQEGLLGREIRDKLGSDSATSRTATGLAPLGPADNAVVWCALWGIAQIPLALRNHRAATTATSVRDQNRQEHFAVPLWTGTWHPARLRSILTSAQLRAAATAYARGDVPEESARQWLAARGVKAAITFPVTIGGSTNAPERRTGPGEIHPISALE